MSWHSPPSFFQLTHKVDGTLSLTRFLTRILTRIRTRSAASHVQHCKHQKVRSITVHELRRKMPTCLADRLEKTSTQGRCEGLGDVHPCLPNRPVLSTTLRERRPRRANARSIAPTRCLPLAAAMPRHYFSLPSFLSEGWTDHQHLIGSTHKSCIKRCYSQANEGSLKATLCQNRISNHRLCEARLKINPKLLRRAALQALSRGALSLTVLARAPPT